MGRITEIGIVLLDDCEVVKTYSALVDPGMPIQPFVQHLTGITDEMVQGKPQFASVAEEVAELLKDRTRRGFARSRSLAGFFRGSRVTVCTS